MEYDIILLECSETINDLLNPMLQKGFYVLSVEGRTVIEFLTEDCSINSGYIQQKIKTIFINGGPVDDIFNTRIKDGEEIALSGAMPGIVGAMMRIGSPYAPMRDNITVKPEEIINTGKKILVGLKLFNAILSDKGMDFLYNGILLTRQRLYDFFVRNESEIRKNCIGISINGSYIETSLILDSFKNQKELILLRIKPYNEN